MRTILNALRERMVFAPGMGLGIDLALSRRGGASSPPVSPGDAMLLESGDFFLIESGTTDKLLLEA